MCGSQPVGSRRSATLSTPPTFGAAVVTAITPRRATRTSERSARRRTTIMSGSPLGSRAHAAGGSIPHGAVHSHPCGLKGGHGRGRIHAALTPETRGESMRLEGRRALVTGGARGIGRGIALGLAREGADVVVGYRSDRPAAERAAAEISALGRRAATVSGDTSARPDVERLVAAAVDALGGLDLLVNNAGILKRTPFLDIDEREWDAILDTNLKGYFLVGQAVARHMIDRAAGSGAIVNVSSAGQLVAAPNLTHYCVAKAGIEMLTKQMALELAPHKIRVNAVCPGLIETDLNRKDIADPAFRDARPARIPRKESVTPADVAGAVVFLASNQ